MIPPFPAQDLAKLVLGYLAEEQLMTAYDEFLQASPYVDVMQNEYDWIFMTSLKNIVAEYRAVKIFVKTCTPFSLRRRLLGCLNLLEVVKVLVQNVDIKKIQAQDISRASSNSRIATLTEKLACEVCHSLRLPGCMCKSKDVTTCPQPSVNKSSSTESSVETTCLSDLPGTQVNTKKRHVKVLSKEKKTSQTFSCDMNSDMNAENSDCSESNTIGPNNSTCSSQVRVDNSHVELKSIPPEQENEERNVLNAPSGTELQKTANDNQISSRLSIAETFQEFSTGVEGTETINTIVPDSSVLENMSSQAIQPKEPHVPTTNKDSSTKNIKAVSKAHILLTVGTFKTSNVISPNIVEIDGIDSSLQNYAGNLRPKTGEKVTILSDVKVDKTFTNEKPNPPAVLKNATSTPLMHMQTILINGTPVYKQQPQLNTKRSFTKDEIMAMPTIIVVPTSGPAQIPPNVQPATTISQTVPAHTMASSTKSLSPLLIDVHSEQKCLKSTVERDKITHDIQDNSKGLLVTTVDVKTTHETQDSSKGLLVKTADVKNATAPKDGEDVNKNTPHGAPPPRKASSTPRRTSHVRVLDFTTPRRILQENITEQSENTSPDVEVVITRSSNLHTLANATPEVEPTNENRIAAEQPGCIDASSKENKRIKPVRKKSNNWDAELRAMAVANRLEELPESRIAPTYKPRTKTKKKVKVLPPEDPNDNDEDEGKLYIHEKVKRSRSTKAKRKCQEVEEEEVVIEENEVIVQETAIVPVKPTINIITGTDWNTTQDTEKSQNKSHSEDPVETPEAERIALQNVIGAKLNISELLETPYKQALYDIQMETPRFLGPDLPGEPLSDIKIMNIPTPMFLNTPKPITATPSSYCSRPTDYSSGGSYYKPDDQDYIPPTDLEYPSSSYKENDPGNAVETPVINEQCNQDKPDSAKPSRPTRSCAKNVSYYSNQLNQKSKEADDKSDANSTCSESTSKPVEKKIVKETIVFLTSGKLRTQKSSTKARNSVGKKRKTPIKKDTPRSFIKIKPRRVTPTKKTKKKSTEIKARKRTSKNKYSDDVTPEVVPVTTKSRRKSSTPRKLHCTKNFNSPNFAEGNESPVPDTKSNTQAAMVVLDSDTEQVPLCWSDEASRDSKGKKTPNDHSNSMNDIEDIPKIKEYIASELKQVTDKSNISERASNLHVDLVKRGFDIETAKSIERDLLDTSPQATENLVTNVVSEPTIRQESSEKESDTSLKIVQDEEDDYDDAEFSVYECNEDSANYITCVHDDEGDSPKGPQIKLKDKFSMEVCMDEIIVRLRATPCSIVLDQDPGGLDDAETLMAVNSISNMDKLYTPLKDPVRAQVYEIFDSTLTSLDTPLKATTPLRKEYETSVTQIVLEVEKLDDKEKVDGGSKRKRLDSVDSDEPTETKKPKAEAQYLLTSANIQNIDIETVLSKLHGP